MTVKEQEQAAVQTQPEAPRVPGWRTAGMVAALVAAVLAASLGVLFVTGALGAGWGAVSDWFEREAVHLRRLGEGFLVTLRAAVYSLVIGFLAAIPAGAVLHRGPRAEGGSRALRFAHWALYATVRGLVDFIRGTPALVQLLVVYFGLPQVLPIRLTPMAAAVLTLSVNCMAYMSEVIRSGLMSVDPGQRLAGRALGLSQLQVFRLVVWPQAFRIAMPPLVNSVVALTKDTALISVITVSEVVKRAEEVIARTYQPMTYYLIVAVMFFAVTFPLMKLAARLEQRMRRKGFSND